MNSYKIIEWSPELDLTDFYSEAARRGFVNNSSQKAMIDCFRNEREWNAWILYKDHRAIGSVAAHSFDDVMGANSYRIMTRICTFAEARPNQGLLTRKRFAAEHQNLSDQFLLPVCFDWVGNKGDVYATSNESNEASQQLVHRHYFPMLEKIGLVKKIKEVYYRHTYQTVWKIYPDRFNENLNRFPRWS
jgi:hypothetical protein